MDMYVNKTFDLNNRLNRNASLYLSGGIYMSKNNKNNDIITANSSDTASRKNLNNDLKDFGIGKNIDLYI